MYRSDLIGFVDHGSRTKVRPLGCAGFITGLGDYGSRTEVVGFDNARTVVVGFDNYGSMTPAQGPTLTGLGNYSNVLTGLGNHANVGRMVGRASKVQITFSTKRVFNKNRNKKRVGG